MWRRVLFLVFLLAAAPALASEGHGGGDAVLGTALKALNLIVFFGILVYLMARPLRGFFEQHTEGIKASIDNSREQERETLELEAKARALASSVEAEVAALRVRFASDREHVKADVEGGTARALARLRADHQRALLQMEEAFRRHLAADTLHSAKTEAMRFLRQDLTEADRARFLQSVTGREGA